MDRLLTAADAARILVVTPATVRLMVRRGDLAVAASTPGGIRLFNEDDVRALAAKRAERKPAISTG